MRVGLIGAKVLKHYGLLHPKENITTTKKSPIADEGIDKPNEEEELAVQA